MASKRRLRKSETRCGAYGANLNGSIWFSFQALACFSFPRVASPISVRFDSNPRPLVFPFQVFQRLTNPWGTPKTTKVVEDRLICGSDCGSSLGGKYVIRCGQRDASNSLLAPTIARYGREMVKAILPNRRPWPRLFEFAPSFQSTPKISRAIPADGLLDQLLAEPFGKRAQAQ
jgi:hypothetical protein